MAGVTKGTAKFAPPAEALDGPQRIVVLTGPACCGKTAAALELYRRRLDALGRPGCLLIAPNAAAARSLRRRLLAGSETSVLISPAVTTFAALAGAILSASGECPDTLSPAQRHLLLVRIVAELAAAGELRALGPLADTPGLTAALDAAIAELKRAAVEPDDLAAAVKGGPAKHRDLLAVYRRYQQYLRQTGRFDVEGQLWLARDRLAADADAALGFEGVTAVAVDGFTDFTPTQLEMLARLSGRVEKMLITLPLADEPARRRLWFWTQRTLERLLEAMPEAAVVAAAAVDPMAGLFDLTAVGAAPAAAQGGAIPVALGVLDAPDTEAEVRAAAAGVRADLAAGTPPERIAVLARGLEAYAEPVARVFARCGIGASEAPSALAAAGVVAYVLRLLSLPPAYDGHDLLAAIRSSYFRPAALAEGFDARTVATAEMAVRSANVLGGRQAYARAFERLGRRARAAAEQFGADETIELGPLAADAEAIERAAAMVEALLARLDALGSAGGLAEYVEAVRELIADLAVPAAAADHADDALAAADGRALAAFDGLLADVAAADLPPGARAAPAEVIARAAAVASAPPARAAAPVAVLDVMDARAVRYEKVYLLGLNENSFPRLGQERCFIDEGDRAAWSARGLRLDRRRDLICREMLLFYLAVTRADEALRISYLASDSSGKGQAASVFLDDLLAAAERAGAGVERTHIGPGEFVPPADELARPADAVNAAILAAFGRRGRRGGKAEDLLAWSAAHAGDVLRRASYGVFAAGRRWREGEVDRFDGRIDAAALLKDLAGRIPAKWTFSATELNAYAQCPWSFFARYLLNLKPLEEPEAEMTPAARGSFCHAVLWRLMTALRDEIGGPVVLADVAEAGLRGALADAVEAERARLADRAAWASLWDAQTEHWRRMLWEYLLDQRAGGQMGAAAYFELGFGLSERRAGRMDPASAAEAVTLTAGQHRIRLAGKIDRVDVIGGDPPGLLAVDYKSGALPAKKDIDAGRDLQLALYAAALEALFDGRCAGGAYHGLRDAAQRYFAAFDVRRGKRVVVEDHRERLAAALATAGRYVQAMRNGRFDALPDHDCAPWCPYRQICQYAPARAERKTGGAAPLRDGKGGGHG